MPSTKKAKFKVGDAVKYNYPYDSVHIPMGSKGKIMSLRKKTKDKEFYEVPKSWSDTSTIKDPYEYEIEWFEVTKGNIKVDKDGEWYPADLSPENSNTLN